MSVSIKDYNVVRWVKLDWNGVPVLAAPASERLYLAFALDTDPPRLVNWAVAVHEGVELSPAEFNKLLGI